MVPVILRKHYFILLNSFRKSFSVFLANRAADKQGVKTFTQREEWHLAQHMSAALKATAVLLTPSSCLGLGLGQASALAPQLSIPVWISDWMGSLRTSNPRSSAGSEEDNESRSFKKCMSGKNTSFASTSGHHDTIRAAMWDEMMFLFCHNNYRHYFHYEKHFGLFIIGDLINILQEIMSCPLHRNRVKKKKRRKSFSLHLEKPEELDLDTSGIQVMYKWSL